MMCARKVSLVVRHMLWSSISFALYDVGWAYSGTYFSISWCFCVLWSVAYLHILLLIMVVVLFCQSSFVFGCWWYWMWWHMSLVVVVVIAVIVCRYWW